MYAFAELDEKSNEYQITEERKAKAFFVYSKIVDGFPSMVFDRWLIYCEQYIDSCYQSIISAQNFTFLVDIWGFKYATLFWDRMISKLSKHAHEIPECIYNHLEAASELFCYKTKLTNEEINDEIIYNFRVVNAKNTEKYEWILDKIFP
jgi:hypothetical protein